MKTANSALRRLQRAAIVAATVTSCMLISTCAAQQPQTPPGANPALEKFGTAITFYSSFDNGPSADLSNGIGTPRDPKLEIELKAGLFGKAFLSGLKGIVYNAESNLDLSKPGSLTVWVSSYEWKRDLPDTPYIFLVNVQTQARGLMLARMGNKLNREAVYAYVAAGKDKFSISGGNSLNWKDGEWHLFVANWRNGSVEFSLDGGAVSRKDAPDFEKVDGKPGVVFVGSVGDPNQKYLVDEFMVLDRPLEADEINWLYALSKPQVPAAVTPQ